MTICRKPWELFKIDPNINLVVFQLFQQKLCQVIYCHGDKSYPCLVGIGLKYLYIINSTGIMQVGICPIFNFLIDLSKLGVEI